MKKPDLKSKLVPEISDAPYVRTIFARFQADLLANIEKLENSAVEVTGLSRIDGRWVFSELADTLDTHRTFIFRDLIEPIERGVTNDEVIRALRDTNDGNCWSLADRIEKEGIK